MLPRPLSDQLEHLCIENPMLSHHIVCKWQVLNLQTIASGKFSIYFCAQNQLLPLAYMSLPSFKKNCFACVDHFESVASHVNHNRQDNMWKSCGSFLCLSAYREEDQQQLFRCKTEKYEVDASSPREVEQMSTQKEGQEDGMESERTQVLLKQ